MAESTSVAMSPVLADRPAPAKRKAVRLVSASELQAGDLVFVHAGKRGCVSYVAIYDGNGRCYEATRPGRPTSLDKPWTGPVSYGRV